MKLRLILVSVITVLALNSCGSTAYIQPDYPILTQYEVKSIDSVDYEIRSK